MCLCILWILLYFYRVLGVFLFCWLPFFSCNIMDAMCAKFDKDCSPGVTAFIFTTWLGYINSFVNPVIYTIFNPEFRKAFKKIMYIGWLNENYMQLKSLFDKIDKNHEILIHQKKNFWLSICSYFQIFQFLKFFSLI